MTADEIKTLLKLEPHPIEGGWFRRTYTSAGQWIARGIRAQGTAIYYLLEPGTFSEMHVLDSDEIFHFYLGDPVEMLQLHHPMATPRFSLLDRIWRRDSTCNCWCPPAYGKARG
jgi:predicted cupin superfamily sugar epimerase